MWLPDDNDGAWSWEGSHIEQGLLKALALPRRVEETPPSPQEQQPPARKATPPPAGPGAGMGPPEVGSPFAPTEAAPTSGRPPLAAAPPTNIDDAFGSMPTVAASTATASVPPAAATSAAPPTQSAPFGATATFDDGAFASDPFGQSAVQGGGEFDDFSSAFASTSTPNREPAAPPAADDFGEDPFGGSSDQFGGTSDPFGSSGAFPGAAALPQAVVSQPFGGDDSFGFMGATPASQSSGINAAASGSNHFGSSNNLLDDGLDFMQLDVARTPSTQSGGDFLNSSMAAAGMADMLASLDSLAMTSPPIAQNAGAKAISAWIEQLPNYSYLLSDTLVLPV